MTAPNNISESPSPDSPAPENLKSVLAKSSSPKSKTKSTPTKRKRGRKPGSPKVPGSGRKKPGPNPFGREGREYLAKNSGYLDLLVRILNGKAVRLAGPTGKQAWHYPDWDDRKWALAQVLPRMIPTLASQEITGDADNPLSINDNREPLSMTELARRTAFLLDFAARDGDETRRSPPAPRGALAAAGEGHHSAAAPAPTTPAPEEAHEAAPEPPGEPNVGETAVIGGFRIERRDPLRDGHPPQFAIRRAQDSVPSLFFTGWPATLKWIMANVPEGTNLTPRIEKSESVFEPVRPEQRAPKFSPGPKIVGSYANRKRN